MCLLPDMQELTYYYLALSKIPKVGPITGKNLINHVGGVEQIFELNKVEVRDLPGLSQSQKQSLIDRDCLRKADQELRIIDKEHIRLMTIDSPEYPYRLKQIDDAPLVLYSRGQIDLNSLRMVSIVGTRQASVLGIQYCKEVVESLSEYDVTVVSGMASGIDGCAHSKALDLDLPTVGVVAHGMKYRYPMSNDRLFDRMEEKGMIMTEHGYSTFGNKDNFPRRNRIVAAMTDATIVVESKKRGGSMITANLANDYNREVFAIPGRVSDKSFEGCNHLIKSHKASLYQSVADLAYMLNWSDRRSAQNAKRSDIFEDLTEREKKIVNYLRMHQECNIDDLAFHCSIDLGDLSSELLQMEFKGMIKALPGSKYLLLR